MRFHHHHQIRWSVLTYAVEHLESIINRSNGINTVHVDIELQQAVEKLKCSFDLVLC